MKLKEAAVAVSIALASNSALAWNSGGFSVGHASQSAKGSNSAYASSTSRGLRLMQQVLACWLAGRLK